MNWKYWLAGLALWILGFISVVGWLLWRWFGPTVQGGAATESLHDAVVRNGLADHSVANLTSVKPARQ